MKLMNVGSRKFILLDGTAVGPMDIVEVDDQEGTALAEGYPEEWKVIEAPKEEKAVEEQPKKKKK